MARRVQFTILAAFVLASGASLAAHDMWIEPTLFLPKVGDVVGLRLRVGQDLIGDPLPRDPALINTFVLSDAERRTPIVGRDGADPAGLIRVLQPGLQIVGYHSRPSPVTLAAEKFNQYLKDEGLDAVAALITARGQRDHEARELFLRCAKSLLSAGRPVEGQGDRALGFPLELIAERNPYALKAGDELPIRLLYEGRAISNVLIVAINRQDPAARLTARSDAAGRVRFKLPRTGLWLVKAVHMVAAPSDANADWVSFWASLTFTMADATPPASRS